jgi:glyoxylase-like metal-dependent hydrolase (beta-lactamase superfamily II)
MADGRVEFLDGDAEVAPGVTCRLARDTHTFGSQWLEIQTHKGPYALAGDVCYTFQNVERMWPPGYTQGNAWNLVREFQKIKAVAGDDLARLLPGHDIELFARHPSAVHMGSSYLEAALAEGHESLLR